MTDFVNENLIYIVPAALGVVLYIAWEIANSVRSRRRRPPAPRAPRPAKRRWRLFGGGPAEPVKPKDDDEFHADAAAQMTRRLEVQAREAQLRHEQRMADIERQLEKARRLVADSGIGVAAVDLLATMWHWPIRARSRDWTRPAGLHELDFRPATETDVASQHGLPKVLVWLWDGRPYRMAVEAIAADGEAEMADREDEVRANLILHVDDIEVLDLDVGRPLAGAEELWTVTDVSALRAGDWMAEFAGFAARLKQADEEKHRQMQFERASAKAARIDLGGFDPDLHQTEIDMNTGR